MRFASTCTAIIGSLLLLSPSNVVQAQCSDVHIVFARGSGEMPGLGICGEPLVSGITSNLGGMSVSSYAAIEFCNMGDPVCGNGFNTMAHMTYPMDSVPGAAEKAAALVKGGARKLRA
ncbi:hypothetical protein AM588_10011198 [Phytophthora nicotianae]|uniref:Uncharacterized protein n=1 Tax=Phytophthora nicotianae TaxID=4792 RepID=A0A0W8DRT8_PHYNI|nr:hypothetical protein AM588_10011198 [Phytophthora nicotianae]